MRGNKFYFAAAALCCILLLTVSAGCTQSSLFAKPAGLPSSDPEYGIVQWMDAMNRQDIIRLYRLAPSWVRTNVTLEELASLNRDNPYFARNETFVQYEVINKTVTGDSADIKAMLIMREPSSGNETAEKNIPIWFHFTLSQEKGEWKVWTVP
jgi:hypothetical protein